MALCVETPRTGGKVPQEPHGDSTTVPSLCSTCALSCHCLFLQRLLVAPTQALCVRHCLSLNEALICYQRGIHTQQSVPEHILAPTEHVTGLIGPQPDLLLQTHTHIDTQAFYTLPYHAPPNSAHIPAQTHFIAFYRRQTLVKPQHKAPSRVWVVHKTHTHKHLSVNSWSVCVRVSACVQRRIWLGCVFNSQCWRKRQKINTRLMGSIVIPTSCHSQRLFTAQQWARHSLSTHTGSLVYLIFSVDICACAQRDIEMDRWALARRVKCLV